VIYPDKKSGHQLAIIYEQLDASDDCPLFDFEIAIKGISALPAENLECFKKELPPTKIQIDEAIYRLDQEYAFSS
jgi:hypothetical protein